jgi:hypothetical protein
MHIEADASNEFILFEADVSRQKCQLKSLEFYISNKTKFPNYQETRLKQQISEN